MGQRQLELWDHSEGREPQQHDAVIRYRSNETKQAAATLVRDEATYVSLKRVALIHEGSIHTRPQLKGAGTAKQFFAEYWREHPGHDQERFVVACLDTKLRVQCVVVVTVGTLEASLVHPREVFKPAIIEGSSAVLLSHNHPSGDPTPSEEDHAVTRRLTAAGDLLGIEVLDHIIHGDNTNALVSIRETS